MIYALSDFSKTLLLSLYNTDALRYYFAMIQSFRCRDTEALFKGLVVARFANIATVALRRLAMLNRAERIDDLRVPPGNRLEALKGARAGQYSIRINGQWRICFKFKSGSAVAVEIVDYH